VVTRTEAGPLVAARSSRWATPLTDDAGRTIPPRVLIGKDAEDQARSEGARPVRRRSTITAATTGVSARTCMA
jgi:hypothetical protein